MKSYFSTIRRIATISILLSLGFFFTNIYLAQADTLYWYNAGDNTNWTTLTGNWWTDVGHTIQAGALPTGVDAVVTVGTVGPNVNIDVWTEPASIDASATGISFTSVLNNSLSINITGNATFNGSSGNSGTVSGNAIFYDTSANNVSGIITGDATFYNENTTNSGSVTGTKTRHYTRNTYTSRDFTADGPWTVKADGAVVDIFVAIYDGTTTLTPLNGGSFVTTSVLFVTTPDASVTSLTTATLNGSIKDNGGEDATEHGFDYGTDPTLVTSTHTTLGAFMGPGDFIEDITGLTGGTTYYVRAYATNSSGTSYGSINSFIFPIFWFNSGVDSEWNTLTGNWWTDVGHTIQAPALPTRNNTVVTLGTVGPNADLDVWAEPLMIDASATGISFTSANSRSINNPITGDITLNGSVRNIAVVTGNATFNDSSYNLSSEVSGTVSGNAVFNDSSHNDSTVSGNATFNDSSYNSGPVSGNAFFYDTSRNGQTVQGDACFALTADPDGGTIMGVETIPCPVPALEIFSASSITQTTATLNGEILDLELGDATERGFNYGLTDSYGTTVTQASGPYGVGIFTADISSLTCGTTYHIRSYAINIAGTGYSSDSTFVTTDCTVEETSSGSSGSSPRKSPPLPPPCIPRPACLDAVRPCNPPQPVGGWCPVAPKVIPPVTPPTTPPGTPPETPPTTTPPTTPPTTDNTPPTTQPPSSTENGDTSFSSFITGNTLNSVLTSTRNFTNDPVVRTFKNIAVTVPLVLSATVLVGSLFGGVPLLNYFFYFLVIIAQLLGIKRTPKPWGTVYDSRTKRPLPFARVEILNTESRKLQSVIADANGRYGFLTREELAKDSIQLRSYLTKYDFPSTETPTTAEQILYPNIYKGGPINAGNSLTNFDIPMDPRSQSTIHSFYFGIVSVKLNKVLSRVADILFVLGVALGLTNLIVSPSITNLAILALILFTFILRKSGFKLKPFGLTKDKETNQTLPFGFIALHNQVGGERVNFTVSDDKGRYFLLTPKGKYMLRAYTPSHISPMRTREIPILTTKGWVSREVGV